MDRTCCCSGLYRPKGRCLNPYSNGIWIELLKEQQQQRLLSLNPYSNGIWIEPKHDHKKILKGVLILILMEYGQNISSRILPKGRNCVLILILMEYGQNKEYHVNFLFKATVLILILMEYGQNISTIVEDCMWTVLILILMEYGQNDTWETPLDDWYEMS